MGISRPTLRFPKEEVSAGLVACPEYGVVAREPYQPNACLYFYQCRECGSVTRPQPGDGCGPFVRPPARVSVFPRGSPRVEADALTLEMLSAAGPG